MEPRSTGMLVIQLLQVGALNHLTSQMTLISVIQVPPRFHLSCMLMLLLEMVLPIQYGIWMIFLSLVAVPYVTM